MSNKGESVVNTLFNGVCINDKSVFFNYTYSKYGSVKTLIGVCAKKRVSNAGKMRPPIIIKTDKIMPIIGTVLRIHITTADMTLS